MLSHVITNTFRHVRTKAEQGTSRGSQGILKQESHPDGYEVVEKTTECRRSLYLAFIDYKMTFQSHETVVVFIAIRSQSVEETV